MAEELIILRGETDGTTSSGTVSLWSDIFNISTTSVRIPRGMKAKIWFKEISGEGETLFTLEYSRDITIPSPSWLRVEQVKLSAKGIVSVEKRRPVILRSFTGKEGFRVSWTQPTATKAYIELGVEFTED